MMVDTNKIRAATKELKAARLTLTQAFNEWDKTVAENHLAWVKVRKAASHVQDAETLLNQALDKAETDEP